MPENNLDLTAFYKMTYGLYIVTAAYGTVKGGCIVNTVTQVTAEPPKVAVSVSKQNYTSWLIGQSGFFTATALTQDAGMDLIGAFGFRSGRDENKFNGFPTAYDQNGVPYVTSHAAAVFSCKVEQQVDLGTHWMFIGEATEARQLSNDELMTYAYYHTVKKGGTPKNAPSYKGEAEEKPQAEAGKTVWRCTVCGYLVEAEELPEDYICPICRQPASVFVKVEA